MASPLPTDFAYELDTLARNSETPFAWRLLGTYSETADGIWVPGYPPRLRERYATRRILWEDLDNRVLTYEVDDDTDCYFFECIETTLRICQPGMKLADFNLITGRSTLRKLDEFLVGPQGRYESYSAFMIQARRYGNLLVLRRKEIDDVLTGSGQGFDFERRLTDAPYGPASNSALIEITLGHSRSQLRILMHCEIDACRRTAPTLTTNDYGVLADMNPDPSVYSPYEITSTGLPIMKPKNFSLAPYLQLDDIVEIKMGSRIDDAFQSFLSGTDTIVHGVRCSKNSPRCTHSISSSRNTCGSGKVKTMEYHFRLLGVLRKVFELANEMYVDKTYLISRNPHAKDLLVAEIEDNREWFSYPPTPYSTFQ